MIGINLLPLVGFSGSGALDGDADNANKQNCPVVAVSFPLPENV